MSFGKPVFLSRLTSLPEIGGSLACYFDSFEAESMVATVRRGLAEFDAAPDRPQALRAYAETFSWKRAAMSYWTLYTEALRSPIR
jgi:glycosyltransferase involved in cell wall biosynthesis